MSSNYVLGVLRQVFMTFEHLNKNDKYFMIGEQTPPFLFNKYDLNS